MRQRTSTTTGLLMSVAAVTLGVASYLHRQGHIPLGFTVIRGESFYGASIPEAVLGFVLAAAAAVVLLARARARRAAVAANSLAILGLAYGMTITVASGRIADIVYHFALMALLLVTEVRLLRLVGSQPAEIRGPGLRPHTGEDGSAGAAGAAGAASPVRSADAQGR